MADLFYSNDVSTGDLFGDTTTTTTTTYAELTQEDLDAITAQVLASVEITDIFFEASAKVLNTTQAFHSGQQDIVNFTSMETYVNDKLWEWIGASGDISDDLLDPFRLVTANSVIAYVDAVTTGGGAVVPADLPTYYESLIIDNVTAQTITVSTVAVDDPLGNDTAVPNNLAVRQYVLAQIGALEGYVVQTKDLSDETLLDGSAVSDGSIVSYVTNYVATAINTALVEGDISVNTSLQTYLETAVPQITDTVVLDTFNSLWSENTATLQTDISNAVTATLTAYILEQGYATADSVTFIVDGAVSGAVATEIATFVSDTLPSEVSTIISADTDGAILATVSSQIESYLIANELPASVADFSNAVGTAIFAAINLPSDEVSLIRDSIEAQILASAGTVLSGSITTAVDVAVSEQLAVLEQSLVDLVAQTTTFTEQVNFSAGITLPTLDPETAGTTDAVNWTTLQSYVASALGNVTLPDGSVSLTDDNSFTGINTFNYEPTAYDDTFAAELRGVATQGNLRDLYLSTQTLLSAYEAALPATVENGVEFAGQVTFTGDTLFLGDTLVPFVDLTDLNAVSFDSRAVSLQTLNQIFGYIDTAAASAVTNVDWSATTFTSYPTLDGTLSSVSLGGLTTELVSAQQVIDYVSALDLSASAFAAFIRYSADVSAVDMAGLTTELVSAEQVKAYLATLDLSASELADFVTYQTDVSAVDMTGLTNQLVTADQVKAYLASVNVSLTDLESYVTYSPDISTTDLTGLTNQLVTADQVKAYLSGLDFSGVAFENLLSYSVDASALDLASLTTQLVSADQVKAYVATLDLSGTTLTVAPQVSTDVSSVDMTFLTTELVSASQVQAYVTESLTTLDQLSLSGFVTIGDPALADHVVTAKDVETYVSTLPSGGSAFAPTDWDNLTDEAYVLAVQTGAVRDYITSTIDNLSATLPTAISTEVNTSIESATTTLLDRITTLESTVDPDFVATAIQTGDDASLSTLTLTNAPVLFSDALVDNAAVSGGALKSAIESVNGRLVTLEDSVGLTSTFEDVLLEREVASVTASGDLLTALANVEYVQGQLEGYATLDDTNLFNAPNLLLYPQTIETAGASELISRSLAEALISDALLNSDSGFLSATELVASINTLPNLTLSVPLILETTLAYEDLADSLVPTKGQIDAYLATQVGTGTGSGENILPLNNTFTGFNTFDGGSLFNGVVVTPTLTPDTGLVPLAAVNYQMMQDYIASLDLGTGSFTLEALNTVVGQGGFVVPTIPDVETALLESELAPVNVTTLAAHVSQELTLLSNDLPTIVNAQFEAYQGQIDTIISVGVNALLTGESVTLGSVDTFINGNATISGILKVAEVHQTALAPELDTVASTDLSKAIVATAEFVKLKALQTQEILRLDLATEITQQTNPASLTAVDLTAEGYDPNALVRAQDITNYVRTAVSTDLSTSGAIQDLIGNNKIDLPANTMNIMAEPSTSTWAVNVQSLKAYTTSAIAIATEGVLTTGVDRVVTGTSQWVDSATFDSTVTFKGQTSFLNNTSFVYPPTTPIAIFDNMADQELPNVAAVRDYVGDQTDILRAELAATVDTINGFAASFDVTGAQIVILEIDPVDIAAEPDNSRKVVNVESVKTYVENLNTISQTEAQTKFGLQRFTFGEAALEWLVQHNRNTDLFDATIKDSNHNPMLARIEIVDANSFKVHLTQAMTGIVDVRF